MSLIFLLIGLVIGSLSTFGVLVFISKRQESKLRKKYVNTYNEILKKLTSNEVSFTSRINNTVQLHTEIEDEGEVQIMYFLDRQDVSIFRDGDCLYTSNLIEKDLIEKILKTIWSKFSLQINDVVQLLNNTFDKRTFMVISGVNPNQTVDTSQIFNVPDEDTYTLDDILDKINEVGYNNLTESEKEFLKNLNK
jgi:hypothetical protein